jgi:Methyltransferase domain
MPASKLNLPIKSYSDIPGWFRWVDRHVFATLLKSQQNSPPGTLVELGVYQGASAVIIGEFWRPNERFVVVDLFGREDLLVEGPGKEANRRENQQQYANLEREQFESNYLALRDKLPEIIEGPTSDVLDHVEPGTVRFLHIDAGHLYEQVREDVINAKKLLRPGGIVAFDDYRTEHTPGVAAAIWQSVFYDGLIPVAITPSKFYGVYDDAAPYQQIFRDFVTKDPHHRWWMQEQQVLGAPLLRIKSVEQPAKPVVPKKTAAKKAAAKKAAANRTAAKQAAAKKVAKKAAAQRAAKRQANANLTPGRRALRKVARNYAPPALARWVVARRRRSAG